MDVPRRMLLVIAAAALTVAGCKPPDISVSETQVKVAQDREGRGRPARAGDIVAIDYRVLLPDGGEVIRDRRYRFELGAGAVISGIDDSVMGMKVGGHRTVVCPPHKHWGRNGYANVPPHTMLTLEIDLVRIE